MAEFGLPATQLAAPQRAGAVPIQGVVEPPSGPIIPSPLLTLTENAVVGFVKDQKKSGQQAIFGAYQRDLSAISQGIESGQITPTQGNTRMRALGTKYAADYAGDSELIAGLSKIKESVTGISTLGDAEDAAAMDKKIRDQEITKAINQGFKVSADMDPQNLQKILDASRTMTQADEQFQRYAREQAEQRAQGSEGRSVSDFDYKLDERRREEGSRQAINSVAFTNVDATMAFGRDLQSRIATGKLTLQDAQLENQQNNQRIVAQLNAVAQGNPALAAPWIALYSDIAKSNAELLDPSKDRKIVEDQLATLKATAQLATLQDQPQTMGLVVASALLPNTPLATLEASGQIAGILARFGSTVPGTGKVDNLVASPNQTVEKGAYTTLKSSLSNIQTGKVSNIEAANTQASNALNHILGQVGKTINDQDVKDTDLSAVSSFMAEPQFAYAVSNGMLDNNARQAARDAWQIKYQNSVVKGVAANLNKTVPMDMTVEGTPGDGNVSVLDNPKLADLVNIDFTGTGIKFTGKINPAEQGRMNSSISMMNDLKKTTTAVNQLIRIGAHLEGSTDYQKYWEANKHALLPDFYADPNRLKEGDVQDGYRFKGGNTRDASNWERVEQTQ